MPLKVAILQIAPHGGLVAGSLAREKAEFRWFRFRGTV